MLVAGAALSLIAPIAAQASDVVNLEEINSYARSTKKRSSRLDNKTFINEVSDDIANLKTRFDGLEARQNNFEAGGFSDTTTLDSKAVFTVGSMDADDNAFTGEVLAEYMYQMNLNTSFNGDDNLYMRLKAGENGTQWKNKVTYHIQTKDTSDQFSLDKIWYTLPIGDRFTAYAGGKIENYYMYITPSIYKPGALKSFKLGGNSNFGASTDIGYGFKYELDNGFGIASNIVDKGADENEGIFAPGSAVKWDTQLAYTADKWHVSGFMSKARNWSSHSYNATQLGAQAPRDSVGYALRAYWMPEEYGTNIPEVSLGYDTKNYSGRTVAGQTTKANSYMIGLTWKDIFQADDKIGFAFTQPLAATEVLGDGPTGEVDPQIWEAYYSFRPNDSMEITPAIFVGNDVYSDSDDDLMGLVVTSSFKF